MGLGKGPMRTADWCAQSEPERVTCSFGLKAKREPRQLTI